MPREQHILIGAIEKVCIQVYKLPYTVASYAEGEPVSQQLLQISLSLDRTHHYEMCCKNFFAWQMLSGNGYD